MRLLFAAREIKALFEHNGWNKTWRDGIYTYAHYHTNTHEALAVIKGYTTLQLGGAGGNFIKIEKGDLLILPAGVGHKNMGHQNDVVGIGGYPQGIDVDIHTGQPGERPHTDDNIKMVHLPALGPLRDDAEIYNILSRSGSTPV